MRQLAKTETDANRRKPAQTPVRQNRQFLAHRGAGIHRDAGRTHRCSILAAGSLNRLTGVSGGHWRVVPAPVARQICPRPPQGQKTRRSGSKAQRWARTKALRASMRATLEILGPSVQRLKRLACLGAIGGCYRARVRARLGFTNIGIHSSCVPAYHRESSAEQRQATLRVSGPVRASARPRARNRLRNPRAHPPARVTGYGILARTRPRTHSRANRHNWRCTDDSHNRNEYDRDRNAAAARACDETANRLGALRRPMGAAAALGPPAAILAGASSEC
jgi:hypothetical protein